MIPVKDSSTVRLLAISFGLIYTISISVPFAGGISLNSIWRNLQNGRKCLQSYRFGWVEQ